ncbi:hypothetical protein [Dyella sp.]|uniref:hypothetical protein n=1 Tax=Dyella sp. TaxID=1869338 RepID=UPI00284AABCF|nr:hypothetical protein [Dyella sp.]MDR3445961.1 hypothetical protein [Dyella sp.]
MTPDNPVVAYRRRRLKEWIDSRFGGVQSEFIASAGVNQGELSGLLRTKSFGEKRARRLEEQAGMPVGYLDLFDAESPGSRLAEPVSQYGETSAQSISNQRRKVWVQGVSAMDEQGFWKPGSAEAELWEVNTDDPKAFAVRVLTQHFDPVAAPGQCLLVSPSQEPRIGRGVLVTLTDGRQSFRTLRGHDYGVWHFADVNRPASYLDLIDSQVARVERVMSVSWTD